jgi:hypothetical protein
MCGARASQFASPKIFRCRPLPLRTSPEPFGGVQEGPRVRVVARGTRSSPATRPIPVRGRYLIVPFRTGPSAGKDRRKLSALASEQPLNSSQSAQVHNRTQFGSSASRFRLASSTTTSPPKPASSRWRVPERRNCLRLDGPYALMSVVSVGNDGRSGNKDPAPAHLHLPPGRRQIPSRPCNQHTPVAPAPCP